MENKINILVVEDDTEINGLLCTILKKQGYEVTGAFSGTEGRLCLSLKEFDLVLLDLMLPGITGEDLIKEIRDTKTMPVIIISAKTELQDKVNLLKLGADDYVTKPFDIAEIIARVEAQLRRYKRFSNLEVKDNKLTYKDIVLDGERMKVTVNDIEVVLTVKEFEILKLMMTHPKKVFTRENLYKHVWDGEHYIEDNTVNVHISNIRTKLSKINKKQEYIKTVWGIGFTMSE